MSDLPEEVRAIFREYNARRSRVEQTCSVCGATMPPSYATRLYCSPRCRKRAERQRRRAEVDGNVVARANG